MSGIKIDQNEEEDEIQYDSATKLERTASVYYNSESYKLHKSVYDGLETAGGILAPVAVTNWASKAVQGVEAVQKSAALSKAMTYAEKHPIVSDMAITAASNTAYQSYKVSNGGNYDPYSLLQDELSAVLTRNRSLSQQLSINLGLSVVGETNSHDYGYAGIGSLSGTLSNYYVNKYRFNTKSINYIVKPTISGAFSSFLSDKDNIKQLDSISRGSIYDSKEK